MSALDRTSFLRRALLADAVVSGIAGLILVGGASFLADRLMLSEPLLRYTGIGLIPYAAFVAYVATRESVDRTAIWAVIGLNVLWLVDWMVLLGG